jgi:hypothetical protein
MPTLRIAPTPSGAGEPCRTHSDFGASTPAHVVHNSALLTSSYTRSGSAELRSVALTMYSRRGMGSSSAVRCLSPSWHGA